MCFLTKESILSLETVSNYLLDPRDESCHLKSEDYAIFNTESIK